MGKFRFCFDPAMEEENDVYIGDEVGSYELANTQLETIANYTLFLHEAGLMPDYSNYGGIQEFYNGKWVDFEED